MIHVITCVVSAAVLAASMQALAGELQFTPARDPVPAPQSAYVPTDTSSPICFETSKLCIPRTPPPAGAAMAHAGTPSASPALKLDLPPEKMRQLIAHVNLNAKEDDDVPVETVNVRAPKTTPDIPGGLASIFWAAKNPLQLWRIFAPIPPP